MPGCRGNERSWLHEGNQWLGSNHYCFGPTATSKPVPSPPNRNGGGAPAFTRDFSLHVASLEKFAAFIGPHANQLWLPTRNNPGKLEGQKSSTPLFILHEPLLIRARYPIETHRMPPLGDICGAVVTGWDEKKDARRSHSHALLTHLVIYYRNNNVVVIIYLFTLYLGACSLPFGNCITAPVLNV